MQEEPEAVNDADEEEAKFALERKKKAQAKRRKKRKAANARKKAAAQKAKHKKVQKKAMARASKRRSKIKSAMASAEEEFGSLLKFTTPIVAQFNADLYAAQNPDDDDASWDSFLADFWKGKLLRLKTDAGIFCATPDIRLLLVNFPNGKGTSLTAEHAMLNLMKAEGSAAVLGGH